MEMYESGELAERIGADASAPRCPWAPRPIRTPAPIRIENRLD